VVAAGPPSVTEGDFRWTGDADDLAVWREYERANKGRQAITWSKALRALLAITDRTDEGDSGAEEVGGEDLTVIGVPVRNVSPAANEQGCHTHSRMPDRVGCGSDAPPAGCDRHHGR
jgi:hypothetical protein